MPHTAEAHSFQEGTHQPVPPKLSFVTPLKRLEKDPEAKKTRGEISSLFKVMVSRGSIELSPSEFKPLPESVRAAAYGSGMELRETFANEIFGEFNVTAHAHSTLVSRMPESFSSHIDRTRLGVDRVLVIHQPNMTSTPVYHPDTGQLITTIPEHKTSDFPHAPTETVIKPRHKARTE